MDFFDIVFSAEFIYTILRLTTPIIFATLSAIISVKCGVVNIATEGIMLITALTSVLISAFIKNIGLVESLNITYTLASAMLIGGLLGVLFILIVSKLDANPILTALAINIIASGGTIFVLWLITGDKSTSTSLSSLKMPMINIPIIKDIPVIGSAFSGHSLLTYLAFLSVVLLHILLYKTSLGLRIRAVGESEGTAKSVGINVSKIRITSLFISGMLSGLGGAYMSMTYLSWFSANIVNGRGFIGLAAEAMGGGTPYGGLVVSLFFGAADATANVLQTQSSIPSEVVQMIPYICTIVGLALISYIKIKKIKNQEIMEGK